ncbi:16S rRNA (uracil(1498)-N(3))-methyltransferase [hydrothermal vent metagenome]|uniref:16S rRNA (uracil(1498)-N(3))-methyltransferase n=1 Tax=hydrothermal vent metagenome TaxID=652676 RepID=A0A3B0QWU1_9ZZZZ
MAKARRFFEEDIRAGQEQVEIRGEEFIHIKKVLRLEVGSPVILLNGKGLELTGVIEAFNKDSALVKVEASSEKAGESSVSVTLLQALLKGDKPELIVQKATELGAARIIFYTNERTVPAPAADKIAGKLERLRRIAIEAVKQCERSVLPAIDLVSYDEALALCGDDRGVILYACETKNSLKKSLSFLAGGKGICLLVGPEGGFTEDEVGRAVAAGFVTAGLGRRILRSETAAIAALAIVQYEFGDME